VEDALPIYVTNIFVGSGYVELLCSTHLHDSQFAPTGKGPRGVQSRLGLQEKGHSHEVRLSTSYQPPIVVQPKFLAMFMVPVGNRLLVWGVGVEVG
jgi:hypothetical protein